MAYKCVICGYPIPRDIASVPIGGDSDQAFIHAGCLVNAAGEQLIQPIVSIDTVANIDRMTRMYPGTGVQIGRA